MRMRVHGGSRGGAGRRARRRGAAPVLALAVLAAPLLVGCHRYTERVTLAADGGGSRVVELEVDRQQVEAPADLDALRRFFGLDGEGWRQLAGADGEIRFRREVRVDDLAGWSGQGGDVLRGAGSGPGADVRLRRTVTVETGRGPRGRTYDYREQLAWTGLKEMMVDMVADRLAARVQQACPSLDRTALAELRGLAAGHLSLGWEVFAGEDGPDLEREPLLSSLSAATIDLVRRAGAPADPAVLDAIVRGTVADEDGVLESRLDAELPGLEPAVWTGFRLELTMPGVIVETSATEREGSTVAWDIDLPETIQAPVVLQARSLLADGR